MEGRRGHQHDHAPMQEDKERDKEDTNEQGGETDLALSMVLAPSATTTGAGDTACKASRTTLSVVW